MIYYVLYVYFSLSGINFKSYQGDFLTKKERQETGKQILSQSTNGIKFDCIGKIK